MKEEKINIDYLTKKRKKIDRKIKRLKRKLTMLEFFMDVGNNGAIGGYSMAGVALLGLIAIGIWPFVSFSILLTLIGLSLSAIIGHLFIYPSLKEKIEDKISKLDYERNEIVEHIDCLRTSTVYHTPTQEAIVETEKSDNQSFEEIMKRRHEEMKQSLLEKARLRHIDVDRIKEGKKAYDSKKEFNEAKRNLKNFLEENDANVSNYNDYLK